jgi:hypothetical protein
LDELAQAIELLADEEQKLVFTGNIPADVIV